MQLFLEKGGVPVATLKEVAKLAGVNISTASRALNDQGVYIDIVVQSVLQNLLMGGALAILIILLFLRNYRPTLAIAASIPISLLFAVALMYFSGVTLNIISLAGLALGVGMLVDNSIVVIENIYRLRGEGKMCIRDRRRSVTAVFVIVFMMAFALSGGMFSTALPKIIETYNLSLEQASLFSIFQSGGMLLANCFTALVVDKLDKNKMLGVMFLLMGGFLFCIGSVPPFVLILLLFVLMGIVSNVVNLSLIHILVQGLLLAGGSVYVNQIIKQAKKEEK